MHRHIPHYNLVLTKTKKLLETFVNKNDPIIEIGCANGNAVASYLEAGFSNITAIESSQAMIDAIPVGVKDKITLIKSDSFPSDIGLFNAIICNWTLHFIQNKNLYLQNIYNSLHKNGILVLTEKTSLDQDLINLYHSWKEEQGVSPDEIRQKQEQLKDVMFINDVDWYLKTLKDLKFNTHIIDADWVFTSFLCRKSSQ